MRLMVFFDLPTVTSENRRNYRKFRKNLILNGFFMLQESVYCRMVINEAMARSVVARIESFKPPAGMICVMAVTEKQFANISFIIGESQSDVITTDKSLVII
ncbi:MAG: CRISPR-associated endonuclease Cas2 [Lentisphaerae bacterium]|nr:CRISPR-associated endonuclease Cas2 [Lentisphaerota bacterium]